MDCAPKQPSSPIADTPCVSGRGGDDDDDAPLLNASFSVPFWLLLDIWKHPVCICVAEQLTAMQSHSKGRMEGGGGSFSPIKAQRSGVDPPHTCTEWVF